MTLLSTFYIATITDERKVIIHRITESPAKAVKYRDQKRQELKRADEPEPDVRILRKDTSGEYVDVGVEM